MVNGVSQNSVYINAALGEGVRHEGTLFPEESNRLKLVRKAVINLGNTVEIMIQDRIPHPKVIQLAEYRQALADADNGIGEFNAPRALEPAAAEALIVEAEAYLSSPEGMAKAARSSAYEAQPVTNVNLEKLLDAAA